MASWRHIGSGTPLHVVPQIDELCVNNSMFLTFEISLRMGFVVEGGMAL